MLVVGIAPLLVACGAETDLSSGTGTTSTTVSGTRDAEVRSWVFDGAGSGDPARAGVLVALFLKNGHISTVESCNEGGGTYRWDGDHLVTGQIMTTAVGCGDDDVVGTIMAVVRNRPWVTVDGTTMTMTGEVGASVVFREIEDDRSVQQADLAGTFMVLPPDGGSPATITLTFDAAGTYRVTFGCSDLGGRLTVTNGRVSHPSMSGVAHEDCAPRTGTTPDEDLLGGVLSVAHLRRTDLGLEVLNTSGARIAVLQRTADAGPSTNNPDAPSDTYPNRLPEAQYRIR